MDLNDDDKIKLKYYKDNRVKYVNLSTGNYYVKYCSDEEIFKEFLTKKIFDIVGINCPKYYMIKEEHCVLSEDLNKYNNFYTADELTINIASINNLKDFFEFQFDKYNRFKNIDELMFQINMMHFIDTLFSNVDRHTGNYGFCLNDDGTCDLVVFDHGEILDNLDKATRPVSFPFNNPNSYALYSKECECRYFMEYADDNVLEMIRIILSKFNINMIRLLMKEVEKDTNYKFKCKRKLFLSYIKNYLMIYKLFLENNKQDEKKYLKSK